MKERGMSEITPHRSFSEGFTFHNSEGHITAIRFFDAVPELVLKCLVLIKQRKN